MDLITFPEQGKILYLFHIYCLTGNTDNLLDTIPIYFFDFKD